MRARYLPLLFAGAFFASSGCGDPEKYGQRRLKRVENLVQKGDYSSALDIINTTTPYLQKKDELDLLCELEIERAKIMVDEFTKEEDLRGLGLYLEELFDSCSYRVERNSQIEMYEMLANVYDQLFRLDDREEDMFKAVRYMLYSIDDRLDQKL